MCCNHHARSRKGRWFYDCFLRNFSPGRLSLQVPIPRRGLVGEIAGSDSCADSTSVIQLPHTLPYQENMMLVSFTYQGHLYHLVEDGHSVQIQHISQKSLRSGQCEQAGVYSSDILTYTNCHSTFSMIPTTPIYGVAAVFIRCADGETLITFLPNTLTHAFDDGISSPLAFGAPCVSQMVPGEYITMWLDHSGFNAALVVESATAPTLLLVRFRPETNSVSMHTLEVPDSIDLYNPTVVCVDDAAGVVHLVDQVGIFSTLRYV
ncbi:hypothetical protein C8R46DRAFT_32787 [Mycena filopes]|nr:hypothetical protein C8R46DRAFT_32787 [Mycena filopes]